jgi:hypothetical protein
MICLYENKYQPQDYQPQDYFHIFSIAKLGRASVASRMVMIHTAGIIAMLIFETIQTLRLCLNSKHGQFSERD